MGMPGIADEIEGMIQHAAHLSVPPEQERQLKVLLAATVRYWLDKDIRSAGFVDLMDMER